jgi:hypothetical protein
MRVSAFWILMLLSAVFASRVDGAGYAVQLELGRDGAKAEVLHLQALDVAPSQGALAFQEDAWTVELLDGAGRSLGQHPVPNPARAASGFMPSRIPVLIQFPDHPSAVRAALRDEEGKLAATIALGANQREEAQQRADAVAAEALGPVPVRAKGASVAFQRQIEFESRDASLERVDCRRRYPMLPPEVVVSREGCDAAAAMWRLPNAQASAGAPAVVPLAQSTDRPSERTSTQPPASRASVKRLVRELASTSRLSGRLRFPAGATPPVSEVRLFVGFDDTGAGVFVQAVPPEFRYEVNVRTGTSIDIDIDPPGPFIATRVAVGVVNADMVRDLDVALGVAVSGRLLFPVGSPVPSTAIQVSLRGDRYSRFVDASPPEFRYSFGVTPNRNVSLTVDPPTPFLQQTIELGTVTTDVMRDVSLRRGAVLSARLVFPRRAPPPNEPVHGTLFSGSFSRGFTAMPPDFRFAVAVEPGQQARLRISPPLPYHAEEHDLGRVAADRDVTLSVRRGQVFLGVVRVRSEAKPGVMVGASASESGQGSVITVLPDQPFQLAVAPGTRFIEASAGGFQPVALAVPPSGDFEGELVLEPALEREPEIISSNNNVRLQFRWDDGRPVIGARAEIWKGNTFFISGFAYGAENSFDAGQVSMALADGDYTLRLWPTSEHNPFFPVPLYARPVLVQNLSVRGQTSATWIVPTPETNRLRLQLTLPPALPGCASSSAFGRIELLQEGIVVARSPVHDFATGAAGSRHTVDLLVGSGRYQLRAVLQGNAQATTPPFVAAQGLVLDAGPFSPARFLRGVLRDHQGRPLAGRSFSQYDDLGGPMFANACAYQSDDEGRFALPMCEGCGFQLPDDASVAGARQFLRITGKVDADRMQDIRLEPGLPLAALAETGTTRVWGDPQAPLRIVFLAEGYAAERETYTDRNGNGLWDGVLWVDVDGDGLYDDGEPATTYGTATFPAGGTDPRATNEPFVDLNGDGVPSFDDRALFERNVQDYLRGLFSTDVFGAYRHAYQAHAVMAYSKQVGMDHGPQWQRDTRFNATFVPDRALINVDYNKALADASAVTPGFDVVVVMINQPVPYGRVNAFVLAAGGMKADARNDLVGAHEFGHKIGGLADEYTEFSGRYAGPEPGGRNSTRFLRRSFVGWGQMLPAGSAEHPSRDFTAGTGLFEGSSYHPAGAYRPSMYSVMRNLQPWFNMPSKVYLDRAHVPAISGRPGRLSVVDAGDCRRLRVTWDVSADRLAGVVLRRGSDRGEVLLSGADRGTLQLDTRSAKGAAGDFVLMDAATGVVLDIEPAPAVRCAQ